MMESHLQPADYRRVITNYKATEKQWNTASKMTGPFLTANVDYLYFDSDACCCCPDRAKALVRAISKKVTGTEWNTECEGFVDEYLQYDDLGPWETRYRE